MEKRLIVKAFIRYKDKYLVLKKKKDIISEHEGLWEDSGGKIDPYEDPISALDREVKKETGLDYTFVKELPEWKPQIPGVDALCKVYLLEADSDKVVLSDEHTEFKWLSAKELQKGKVDLIYKEKFLWYLNLILKEDKK
jgi:8-oxo-dGTP diphosphatase